MQRRCSTFACLTT